jgi:hypothetical protein
MNKQFVTLASALAIAASGGLVYAQSQSSEAAANANGVPGVELNVGKNAANDGGVPGVEMNAGANGDQQNVDTSTLGAGSSDLSTPRVDRN